MVLPNGFGNGGGDIGDVGGIGNGDGDLNGVDFPGGPDNGGDNGGGIFDPNGDNGEGPTVPPPPGIEALGTAMGRIQVGRDALPRLTFTSEKLQLCEETLKEALIALRVCLSRQTAKVQLEILNAAAREVRRLQANGIAVPDDFGIRPALAPASE